MAKKRQKDLEILFGLIILLFIINLLTLAYALPEKSKQEIKSLFHKDPSEQIPNQTDQLTIQTQTSNTDGENKETKQSTSLFKRIFKSSSDDQTSDDNQNTNQDTQETDSNPQETQEQDKQSQDSENEDSGLTDQDTQDSEIEDNQSEDQDDQSSQEDENQEPGETWSFSVSTGLG